MRAFEFLIEYKQDITLRNYGNKLSQPEGKDASEVITAIEQMDPTKNNQYTEWLVRQYIKGQFKISDAEKVKNTLTNFHTVKNNLEKDERDINRYKEFNALRSKIEQVHGSEDVAPVSTNKYPVIPDSKVLYNGPLGQLAIPETEEASCELGSGTKWCTSSEYDSQFSEYNNQGPLYVWRDKSGKKYQFHFPTCQFMDAQDREISDDVLAKMKKHPVLKKYMFDVEAVRMAHDPNAAYNHALDIGQRFPAGEGAILRDPDASQAYAQMIIKGRWPEAEKTILTSPEASYRYARNVIKGRWPEAEETILQDQAYSTALDYAKNVIKGRWPEAEPLLADSAWTAYGYAKEVLQDRFPEGEPMILKQPVTAYQYALNVIKGPWPEFEKSAGVMDSFSAMRYAENVLKHPEPAKWFINAATEYSKANQSK